jgi:transcriptional regulator with XRE-family HTH domain
MNDFGVNLRKYRELKGLSQHDLATLAGVTQSLISHLELGNKRNPSLRVVIRLSDHLGVSVDDLLAETEGELVTA